MATEEYIDLFVKSQKNGLFHMFTFDIVDSKKMSKEIRCTAQEKMEKLMLKIYEEIEKIEKVYNKKILIKTDEIKNYHDRYKVSSKSGMLYEPFLFGDMFGFTIYRDSLNKEIIIKIYEKLKNDLNIDFDFHINDGYYETNKYGEGGILFFRGYAIDIISNYHKKRMQQLIENENKKILRKKIDK